MSAAGRTCLVTNIGTLVTGDCAHPIRRADSIYVEDGRIRYPHMERGARQAAAVPDRLVDRFALAGEAAACRAAVDRLRESGIGQLAIVPYGAGDGGREATMRELARAVRP